MFTSKYHEKVFFFLFIEYTRHVVKNLHLLLKFR